MKPYWALWHLAAPALAELRTLAPKGRLQTGTLLAKSPQPGPSGSQRVRPQENLQELLPGSLEAAATPKAQNSPKALHNMVFGPKSFKT